MAPLFTVIVLTASLLPQTNAWNEALHKLEVLTTTIKSIPSFSLARDFPEPPVIYFDAPTRPYDGVLRR